MTVSSTVKEPAKSRKHTVGNIFYFHFGGQFPLGVTCEKVWAVWYLLERWERGAGRYWVMQERMHKSQLRITAESPHNTDWLDNKISDETQYRQTQSDARRLKQSQL